MSKQQFSIFNFEFSIVLPRIISLCLFSQLLLCSKLWQSVGRDFPLIPVFEKVPFTFITSFDQQFYYILLASLILIFIRPKWKWANLFFLLLSLVLILQDVNRLQVWFYQMWMMLLLLFFVNEKNKSVIFSILQFMIIAIYFWSGIHKFNIYFIEDIFPWFIEKSIWFAKLGEYEMLALSTAIFECLLGLLLFFKRTRFFGLIASLFFHVIILFFLGPLLLNWNEVVWPWNVAMMAMLFILFYKKENAIFFQLFENQKIFLLKYFVILLFGILPLFNFFQRWPEQLSFKMYSGVNPEGVFYFGSKDRSCLPEYLEEDIYGTTVRRITLDDWAFKELKVPPYVSCKSLFKIGRHLCDCVDFPERSGLQILTVDRMDKNNDWIEQFPCDSLLLENYD